MENGDKFFAEQQDKEIERRRKLERSSSTAESTKNGEYIVIRSEGLEELEKTVSRYLKNGYATTGGVCVLETRHSSTGLYFAQALVLRTCAQF